MIKQLTAAFFAGAALVGVTDARTHEADPMVYELRTYTTEDGKLPDLHARFRDHTMRLFEKHGMTNVGYWTPLGQPNTLVYIIAHESRTAADESWRAFGSDPEWQRVARESQQDGRILIPGGVQRQFLEATDYSPMQ